MYCSARCRVAASRKRRNPIRRHKCRECREWYVPSRKGNPFCSAECRRRWWNRIMTARYQNRLPPEQLCLAVRCRSDALRIVREHWPNYLSSDA